MIVVQGTVSVLVWIFVVVCFSAVAVPVAVAPAVAVEIAVTIPGFTSTYSPQIPIKYDSADCSSSSDPAHDCTHEMTLLVNFDDGQKHFVSLFDVQFGRRLSQVFKQRGTRFGQEADCVGAGPDEDDSPGDWRYVVTEGLEFEEMEIGMRVGLELGLELEPELEAITDVAAGIGSVEIADVNIPATLPTQAGHTDDVDVRVTVETVLYTDVLCVPPVVIVAVRGQVVTVS